MLSDSTVRREIITSWQPDALPFQSLRGTARLTVQFWFSPTIMNLTRESIEYEIIKCRQLWYLLNWFYVDTHTTGTIYKTSASHWFEFFFILLAYLIFNYTLNILLTFVNFMPCDLHWRACPTLTNKFYEIFMFSVPNQRHNSNNSGNSLLFLVDLSVSFVYDTLSRINFA